MHRGCSLLMPYIVDEIVHSSFVARPEDQGKFFIGQTFIPFQLPEKIFLEGISGNFVSAYSEFEIGEMSQNEKTKNSQMPRTRVSYDISRTFNLPWKKTVYIPKLGIFQFLHNSLWRRRENILHKPIEQNEMFPTYAQVCEKFQMQKLIWPFPNTKWLQRNNNSRRHLLNSLCIHHSAKLTGDERE